MRKSKESRRKDLTTSPVSHPQTYVGEIRPHNVEKVSEAAEVRRSWAIVMVTGCAVMKEAFLRVGDAGL